MIEVKINRRCKQKLCDFLNFVLFLFGGGVLLVLVLKCISRIRDHRTCGYGWCVWCVWLFACSLFYFLLFLSLSLSRPTSVCCSFRFFSLPLFSFLSLFPLGIVRGWLGLRRRVSDCLLFPPLPHLFPSAGELLGLLVVVVVVALISFHFSLLPSPFKCVDWLNAMWLPRQLPLSV